MRKLFLFLLLSCVTSIVCADDARDLGQIVVTPFRYEGSLAQAPGSVQVITREDIDNSHAKTALDLLRPLSGVNVSDWYGNGMRTSVDMAGFGEQAFLNTLVLVDGRRVNDVDLSGTDWSIIPVSEIERIEIVRSGSGGVLYGENASGGVINIITRKGAGKTHGEFEANYGSYQYNDQKLSLGGSKEKLSYWVDMGRQSTQGYRENSFSNAKDLTSRVGFEATDRLTFRLNGGWHDAEYGMPGALWQTQMDNDSRRFARYGRDHAINRDYYYLLGATSDFKDFGILDLDTSYRRKTTDSFFLTSGLWTQRSRIDTYGLTPKYTLKNTIFDHENTLVAGIDDYLSDYMSDKYDQGNVDDLKTHTRIRKTSVGAYVNDDFKPVEKLTLSGGYRLEQAAYLFNYHDATGWNPDIHSKVHYKDWAAHGGVSYEYMDNSTIYTDLSRSLRFPEVDEFTYNDGSWQQQLNTELRPQMSVMYEIGVRQKISDGLKADASVYRMHLTDELYYNSTGGPLSSGQNQNYDQTIHQGAMVSLEDVLNKYISLTGGYTYTHAYFDGGEFNKNSIPLVARHKTSAGVKVSLPGDFVWHLTGVFVGKRYALNDQANAHGMLNGYAVANTSLDWQKKDWSMSVGVNNLFNKKYAEYGGWATNPATSAPDRFYYPSPERNYTVGVKRKF